MAEHTDYFDNAPQYPTDTFFPLQLQPSASDSAQTPPSPVSYSKPRPSRSSTHTVSTAHHSKSAARTHKSQSSRRSTAHSHALSQRSSSNGPSVQFRRERERQLANTPRDHLIHLTISKEYESREAKHLLTTALVQLESNRERLMNEQDMRRALEEEKKEQGVKTTKAIIDTQKEAMSAKEEVRSFQLQLENAQRELLKANESIQRIESEKADLEQDLVRARSSARSFKEQAVLLQAREEGRREGFEEGLRQGRAMHGVIDLTQMPPPAQLTANEPKPSNASPSHPKGDRRRHSSSETEMENEDIHKIRKKEILRLRLQLSQVERERDLERQKNKEADQDKRRLIDETERLKKELRSKDEEIAKRDGREKKMMKEIQAKDNKLREMALRSSQETEGLVRQLEEIEDEKAALNKELRRERENAEKDKADAERRVQEERRERDKDKEASNAATIAAAVAAATSAVVGATSSSKQDSMDRPKYIPMPPPPHQVNGPAPRTTSVGSGSLHRGQRRRFSVGSASSTGSTVPEMLQLPPGAFDDKLSVIHEVDDAGSNASPHLQRRPEWPSAWTQPTTSQVYAMPHGPVNTNFLQPNGSIPRDGPLGKHLNRSLSTIEIQIEPPSRPPSSIDQQEVDGGLLSPNHRPVALPRQDPPLPTRPRSGSDAPISTTPVIPGVTVPMPQPPRGIPAGSVGQFPAGFVPQTITDSRGVSTPISWQSGGVPLPPGPEWSIPKSTPMYGNPLNKDRKQEDPVNPPSVYGPAPGPVHNFPRSNGPMSMTPGMSTRELPGPVVPKWPDGSIYGPPAPGTPWGYPSGPVIPGPLPPSSPHPEEEDEEEAMDPQTVRNTRMNAAIGKDGRPGPGYGQPPAGYRGFGGNNGNGRG